MNLRWPLLFHFRLKSFGFVRLCAMPSKAELNFHLLKSTKVKPLEVLVVLGVSKYGFYILWPLTAVFKTFR